MATASNARRSGGGRGSASSSSSQSSEQNSRGGKQSRAGLLDVVRTVQEQLEALLRQPIEAVSGVERTDDGFLLRVEVVELERVPDSTSVLGSYEVEADGDGNIVGYERVRRYYRNQAGES